MLVFSSRLTENISKYLLFLYPTLKMSVSDYNDETTQDTLGKSCVFYRKVVFSFSECFYLQNSK